MMFANPPATSSVLVAGEAEAAWREPSILWAGILRNETLLVQATVDAAGVDGVASALLDKGPQPGWVSYLCAPGHPSYRGGFKHGLKFHLYEEGEDKQLTIWIFACVFDARRLGKELAQAFVEQKMVLLTTFFREMKDWKFGDHLACQESFGSVLRQRVGEMTSMESMATNLSPVLDDGLELSNEIIRSNKALLQRRSEDGTVFNSWSQQRYDEKPRTGPPQVSEVWDPVRMMPSSPSKSVETMDMTEVSFSTDGDDETDDDDVISMDEDDQEGVFFDEKPPDVNPVITEAHDEGEPNVSLGQVNEEDEENMFMDEDPPDGDTLPTEALDEGSACVSSGGVSEDEASVVLGEDRLDGVTVFTEALDEDEAHVSSGEEDVFLDEGGSKFCAGVQEDKEGVCLDEESLDDETVPTETLDEGKAYVSSGGVHEDEEGVFLDKLDGITVSTDALDEGGAYASSSGEDEEDVLSDEEPLGGNMFCAGVHDDDKGVFFEEELDGDTEPTEALDEGEAYASSGGVNEDEECVFLDEEAFQVDTVSVESVDEDEEYIGSGEVNESEEGVFLDEEACEVDNVSLESVDEGKSYVSGGVHEDEEGVLIDEEESEVDIVSVESGDEVLDEREAFLSSCEDNDEGDDALLPEEPPKMTRSLDSRCDFDDVIGNDKGFLLSGINDACLRDDVDQILRWIDEVTQDSRAGGNAAWKHEVIGARSGNSRISEIQSQQAHDTPCFFCNLFSSKKTNLLV